MLDFVRDGMMTADHVQSDGFQLEWMAGLNLKLDQWEVAGFDALNRSLAEFRFFYSFVRPHQHLQGRTPAGAGARVDPFAVPVKREYWFEAWGGLLHGYYLRR